MRMETTKHKLCRRHGVNVHAIRCGMGSASLEYRCALIADTLQSDEFVIGIVTQLEQPINALMPDDALQRIGRELDA